MKKFWKKTEGFTLVELVVVIAILGILAGVGTVGYSGYVKKANMAADEQLISQVKNALALAAYTPGNGLDNGDKITLEYGKSAEASVAVQNAMVASFGGTWETLKDTMQLKYSGWQDETEGGQIAADYTNSSFNGNEEVLLNQVQKLSGVLSSVAQTSPQVIGSSFSAYLNSENLDPSNTTVAGNGALLYVANQASGMDEAKTAVFKDGITKYLVSGKPNEGISDLTSSTDSAAAAAASIYAMMAAYSQFAAANGNNEPQAALNNMTNSMSTATSTQEVIDLIGANYNSIIYAGAMDMSTEAGRNNYGVQLEYFTGVSRENVAKYVENNDMAGLMAEQQEKQASSQLLKDADAYLSTMKAVNENKDLIKANIDKSDCYTSGTLENEVKTYLQNNDGKIVVAIAINGTDIRVTSNLDK